MSLSVVLLAGGAGSRMAGDIPKQYRMLGGKPIALHSFELFMSLPEVSEVVVVCHPDYRDMFCAAGVSVLFAMPGERRQDSVYNGIQQVSSDSELVCVHDSARPFVTRRMVLAAIEAAQEYGAATVGVPVKPTIKKAYANQLVECTLDRSQLWEIQTPQIIRTALLKAAFAHAIAHQLPVTDDVSLVEAYGLPVKLVQGDYYNLKITTPDDLIIAETFLDRLALIAAHG